MLLVYSASDPKGISASNLLGHAFLSDKDVRALAGLRRVELPLRHQNSQVRDALLLKHNSTLALAWPETAEEREARVAERAAEQDAKIQAN